MVVGVVTPAKTIHVLRQLCDEVIRAGDALHVVTGLIKRVEIVGEHDLAIALLEQEELELHTHLEAIAHLLGARRGVLEDRARAEVVRSAIDCDVAGKAGKTGLKWHRRVRLGVGDRRNVGRGGRLADWAGRKAGKAGTVVEQHVQPLGRYQLGAGLAVHIDELGEKELNSVGRSSAAYFFFVLGVCHRNLLSSWGRQKAC